MTTTTPFIRTVYSENGSLEKTLLAFTKALNEHGLFSLALGSTASSDREGLSAAGSDAAARRLTPTIDAEALVHGTPLSAAKLPRSPAGIVSPVVISRAMLPFLNCQYPISIFDCGTFHTPKCAVFAQGDTPANCLSTGHALNLSTVSTLYEKGQKVGFALAQKYPYVIIGECVPGGTTTALGVLTALGYQANNLVSSSMLSANIAMRTKLVADGFRKAGLTAAEYRHTPLKAVAALGDPMQPFVAGLALAAAQTVPVILAGGTQMLAIWALMQALARSESDANSRAKFANNYRMAIITTKWVAAGIDSPVAKLAQLVGAPIASSNPNFALLKHSGLRAYEEGHVKEGVGAGALMAAAFLKGKSETEILLAIDHSYDELTRQC